MLTALDSNVLIDIWNGSERLSNAAGASLRTAQSQGIVLISDVAYAEICTIFNQQSECDSFLNDLSDSGGKPYASHQLSRFKILAQLSP